MASISTFLEGIRHRQVRLDGWIQELKLGTVKLFHVSASKVFNQLDCSNVVTATSSVKD